MSTQDRNHSGAAVRGEAVADPMRNAVDAAYPLPSSPHGSVLERAYSQRAAFMSGYCAAVCAGHVGPAFTSPRAADALDSQPTENEGDFSVRSRTELIEYIGILRAELDQIACSRAPAAQAASAIQWREFGDDEWRDLDLTEQAAFAGTVFLRRTPAPKQEGSEAGNG